MDIKQINEAYKKYKAGLTLKQLSKDYPYAAETIRQRFIANNLPLRIAGSQKGKDPWNKGKSNIDAINKSIINRIESGSYKKYKNESQKRRAVRSYLLLTGENICDICGITEWMNQPILLICDHIDGDSNNNEIDNFRLICSNCDAQLPTYKSRNRGNGRKYDREYKQHRR